MEIIAYGEDALTFWAMKNKLGFVLEQLADHSAPPRCQVFFRPSFGRSGGDHRSEFGEFDFIILADRHIYPGESKWDGSSERIRQGDLALRPEQKLRHKMFEFYLREWAFGDYSSWQDFQNQARPKLRNIGINKPIPESHSRLAVNLQTVFGLIRERYAKRPDVRNLLLYLYHGKRAGQLPSSCSDDFEVVCADYSEVAFDNFVKIQL